MSRDDLHFRLRIPEDLKKKVEISARENHRSMTAEIIARLEATFPDSREPGQIGPLGSIPDSDVFAFRNAEDFTKQMDYLVKVIRDTTRRLREAEKATDDDQPIKPPKP